MNLESPLWRRCYLHLRWYFLSLSFTVSYHFGKITSVIGLGVPFNGRIRDWGFKKQNWNAFQHFLQISKVLNQISGFRGVASHSFVNIFPSCRAKYHFQIPDIQTLQVRFYLDLAVFWRDEAASSSYSNDAQPCIQSENMKSWSKMPKWVFHIRILFNLGPAWFQRGLLTASHIFPVQSAICKANTWA